PGVFVAWGPALALRVDCAAPSIRCTALAGAVAVVGVVARVAVVVPEIAALPRHVPPSIVVAIWVRDEVVTVLRRHAAVHGQLGVGEDVALVFLVGPQRADGPVIGDLA